VGIQIGQAGFHACGVEEEEEEEEGVSCDWQTLRSMWTREGLSSEEDSLAR
jgi:hypothetical protein